MTNKITYWLDWEDKIIKSNNPGLNNISWAEIENYPITVFCSQNDWPYIEVEEQKKLIITNEEARTYQIGKATIKELRGASEETTETLGTQSLKKCFELCPDFVSEHPTHSKEVHEAIGGWVFRPRFENLVEGNFTDIHKIDIKSCHGQIMREYPLPYGEPTHLKDPKEIAKQLKEGKSGFVRFYLKNGARIKNNQIPFIPDFNSQIKSEIKGRMLLHTRLFDTFCKQYKIIKPIIYTDFWIFEQKKGCVDKFLDYCEKKKEEVGKIGKMLTNAFYGATGKVQRRGYNYRAWTLAINHLAILQTYYLYRQFQPEQVLAIRSDCIYIQGKLPTKLLKEVNKYHITHYQKITLLGKDNIFVHDTQELKSFVANKIQREKLINQFKD